ncbi:MAG: hypothetical protein U9R48_00605 [Chloroflexota bacterium]|nr:hypothetical protein [Chloroflexota bacterium]
MAVKWQRPTVDTKFHIDLDWWKKRNRDIRIYMRDVLCGDCREEYGENFLDLREVDWVDEQTGEVKRVDPLWYNIQVCCSAQPDYITPHTPIVDAVFRTFLANGNEPLSIQELYELLDRRPPEVLLRILTAGQVYMGIRPVI